MAAYNVYNKSNYIVLADYDDGNGDTVTNQTNKILKIGLTTTDGVTVDATTIVNVNPGATATFASGSGAGRKIIALTTNGGSVIGQNDLVAIA
jgi:hypothetical protein